MLWLLWLLLCPCAMDLVDSQQIGSRPCSVSFFLVSYIYVLESLQLLSVVAVVVPIDTTDD